MLKPMIAATLTLVSACAVQTPSQAHALPYAAACEVRETYTSDGIRLEAIAHADRTVQGDYDFTITAQGSGGSSDIVQAGQVDLSAGQSATIATTEISQGRYRALLTLTDAGGELCRLERRS